MFDSITTTALTSALDSLAERQRAIANNVANVNTPGYLAKRVLFENELAASVASGDGAVSALVVDSLEPTKLNGNNVNLDTETLSNIDTVLRYQFAARAVEGAFSGVRTAMRSN